MSSERTLKEKCDGYQQTVMALAGFSQHVNYEYDGCLEIGTKLEAENNSLTPDGAGVIEENYGLVLEVKRTTPKDYEHKKEIFEQLERYDQKLEGWPGDNNMGKHDILCITSQKCSRNLIDDLERYKTEESNYDRPIIVCSMGEDSSQTTSVWFFKKERGEDKLRHKGLEESLDTGLRIPIKNVIEVYDGMRFTDDKPPMPYLLGVLWDHVFSNKIQEEEYLESGYGKGIVEFNVNVEELTKTLQKEYGLQGEEEDRMEVPRKSWVEKALECLKKMNRAERIDQEKYKIRYKNLNKDGIQYFSDQLEENDKEGLEKFIDFGTE